MRSSFSAFSSPSSAGRKAGFGHSSIRRVTEGNYVGDAQNTFPIWNATPLVALDVYEHAYFLDFQTDRGSYIDAFFANLDWRTINDWVERYEIRT
jgi:hypothetical protein